VEAALKHGGRMVIVTRLVLLDGATRVVRVEGEVHRNAARRIVRVVGTVQDITEQAKLEEQFRQVQKMEAVGRLAGGIAHDFNNLLMLIKGYSELLAERGRADENVRRYAMEIDTAADRATSLTRQLLAFGRRQVLEPRVLDLNEVVRDVQKMLVRLISEDIELVTRLEPELGHVRVDPGQLEQVLLNLAVNARDAMPRGGRLTIETANVKLDDGYARQHNGVTPGPFVMLAISDTGVGMSEEVRAHIFEPFYTTKEKGKGTGLGLATVYGIVKQSGGNIWVYSELGHGTTFKMYFPLVHEPAEAMRGRRAESELPRGSETVLLAEDAEPVRALAREFLEGLGYRVLDATNVEHAIRLAESHEGFIDVLMTDLVMPQMSGRELAQRVAAMRPAMRVLYMSGYTDEMILGGEGLAPGVAFLQKPFTREALARKMRELLAVAR
jgi:signal transduction histidine kinase/CheY-like chemotaxis protein